MLDNGSVHTHPDVAGILRYGIIDGERTVTFTFPDAPSKTYRNVRDLLVN